MDDCLAAELDRINRIVDSFPSYLLSDGDRESNEKLEYQLPVLREEFQTARLFLSHLGFLSLQNLQVIKELENLLYTPASIFLSLLILSFISTGIFLRTRSNSRLVFTLFWFLGGA